MHASLGYNKSQALSITYMEVTTCVQICAHIIFGHLICCYAQTGQKQIYGEVINSAGPTKRHAPVTIIIPPTVRHRGIFRG